MEKVREKIWGFIDENKIFIFLVIITSFAIFLRLQMYTYTFGDYEMFLEPWFNELKAGGGLAALGKGIGNYNPPYMTILALLTYLPFKPIESIRTVSVIFDFVCAVTVAMIAIHIFKNNKHREKIALLGYSLTLFLPTVFLNSACWSQADSIYTAFVLISLLCLMKQKYIKAFIFLGVAFSFKLQFIFILPLYILIYISERKFTIFHFLIPVVTNFVLCVPSLIFGNTIEKCINIYIGQMGTYNQYITLNFPNLYSIFFGSSSNLVETPNEYLPKIGIVMTMFIFIIIAFLVLYKRIKFDNKAIVEFGLWSVLICTFFLPHMHDRYMFIADILGIAYLMFNKKKFYIPLMIELVSIYGYMHFLFSSFNMDMKVFGILFLVLIAIYSKDMYANYFLEKE